jgi:hypothetical protein
MPITSPIQNATDLRAAVHAMENASQWTGLIQRDHFDGNRLSFEPNILDAWARGEYFEIKQKLLRPSISTATDSNFHQLREYIRDITRPRLQPIDAAAKLPDSTGEKFPILILEDGRVRVTYFRTVNDCRNDVRTTTTVARYLIGEGFSGDNARGDAEHLDAQYGIPVYDILTDSTEIADAYKAMDGSISSCMTKPSRVYGLPDTLHPTMGHGAPGELGMAVLWTNESRTSIAARCMVWPARKIFNRCYGLSDKLANTLISQGWTFGNFEGAKIAVPVFDMEVEEKRKVILTHLIPYIDTVVAESTNYSSHTGAARYIHSERGVFVHEGTAYLELELTADLARVRRNGFTQSTLTTNHHSTGQTRAIAYYYPGKDKIYVADRTHFVQVKGRAKPRRYDIAELDALGYDEHDLVTTNDVLYTRDMLYLTENDTFVTPQQVWDAQDQEPMVIFPSNIVVPRRNCRVAVDTGQYARERDLYLDALNREHLQNRQRYVATLVTNDREISVTASSLEHIFDLTRETNNGRITFSQTDFDNGEVQLQVINPRTGDRTVRQVGGYAS